MDNAYEYKYRHKNANACIHTFKIFKYCAKFSITK